MNAQAHENYLTTEVMTATPQKLQLMLIEAALRLGREAVDGWEKGDDEAAGEALVRCQQIISELLCGLRPEQDTELVRRVASVYLYIFRSLSAAHVERDAKKVTDAMSVLEVERETWREVCEKLGSHRDDATMESSGLTIDA